MSLITLKEILKPAREHRFAIGAFNAVDNNFIDAIFDASFENKSPIIINYAEVHAKKTSFKSLTSYILSKSQEIDVPVCLNLDHGLSVELVKEAIELGFSSIMFDASRYDFKENIIKTSEVAMMCHDNGVSIEGELGAVGGDEGGKLEGSSSQALYTRLEDAIEFVDKTKIDALAVAIGNSHGRYKGPPKLDFNLLNQIKNEIQIPLVLHGGSGISDEDFKKAISLGICKINFFTGMSDVAMSTIEKNISNPQINSMYDRYLLLMQLSKDAIKDTIKEQMEIFGSINKGFLYE